MANTQEIDDYLAKYARPSTSTSVPPQGGGSPTGTRNIVEPFRSSSTTTTTQNIGENRGRMGYGAMGHEGQDFVNPDTRVTNPIGGINVTGSQYPGYGNWEIIAGASPQELAQMSPEEKQAIRATITQYMVDNPSDIRGLNIPGKNISMQSHLASPAPANSEIATGSANLTMGGSGGWAPHLHSAYKDTTGNMQQITDLIKKELQKRLEPNL